MNQESEILAAGADIIYVLEQDRFRVDGTADLCAETLEFFDSQYGWCVGDAQTEPVPGTFDDSPFSVNRGFDIIVDRRTMQVVWESSHGSGANDNPSGEEVLAAVQQAVADARAR